MLRKRGFSTLSSQPLLSLHRQYKSIDLNLTSNNHSESFDSKASRPTEELEDNNRGATNNDSSEGGLTPRTFQPKILINKTS